VDDAERGGDQVPVTGRRVLFLATVAAVVLAIVPLDGAAAGGALPFYAAIGNAESARVTYSLPGAPLTEVPVDGGGTRSQASSGGIDGSRAYAAAPDPGEAVVALPSLLRGQAKVDLPEYPLAAASQDPVNPEQTADLPGIHLHAASSQQHSQAETVIGSADGQVRTTATAGVVDDEVVAHAQAIISDLNTGPLRISGLRSAATLTRHADGTITRDRVLTVASASISGIPISIGADGITVANTAIPIPSGGSLHDLLRGSGIDVHVLAGESTDTSVMSPALVITTPFTSLTDKPGTATYVIGRAAALLDVVTPRSPSDRRARPSPLSSAPPTAIVPGGPTAGSVTSTPIVTPFAPAEGSTVPSILGRDPSPVPSAPGGIARQPGRDPSLLGHSLLGTPIAWQLRNIYLAFVIAALVLTAGNAALRHLGVRS
jgi:hypothetical protein